MNDKSQLLLFKYGGNAMLDSALQEQMIRNICALKQHGDAVVVVHGGGPFIKNILQLAHIESEFIDGHRRTTPEALKYVEMALKGEVNGKLVGLINSMGERAVGLSGKDAKIITARKRIYQKKSGNEVLEYDLGQVGDVASVDTSFIRLLLQHDYIPVITCLAADEDGNEYNINADMFAGHLAGALQADQYVVLTDVDGLLMQKDDPSTLITEVSAAQTKTFIEQGVIQGGMIPKIDSCLIALEKGAGIARIINGTVPEQLLALSADEKVGTCIKPDRYDKK